MLKVKIDFLLIEEEEEAASFYLWKDALFGKTIILLIFDQLKMVRKMSRIVWLYEFWDGIND